jgi:preprotein translocase subunit SecF
MEILRNPNYKFMKTRGIAAAVSIALALLGLGSLIKEGGPRYSIDFTGGSILQIQFQEAVSASEVRDALEAVGLGDASIQGYGTENEVLVRVPTREDGTSVEQVKSSLRAKWPDLVVRREDTVGPKIGSELRRNAGQAIFWSLLGILVYVSVRFQFRFAVAGVIALIHDVAITLGLFSMTRREVSLEVIAAFLTLVGWSINDTIVIFDRIRENLRVPTREGFEELVNRSINQSLARTIITFATVFLSTAILYFFGGEVLRDFAFVMVVGGIVGTYSTVWIASAILVEWEQRWPRKTKAAKARA